MGRFNTGTMTVGIFAVLFGLVGAYALRAALVREAPPAKEPPRTVNVPLANNLLPEGRKVALSDIALVPMTQEMMLQRKLPLETLMISAEQIVGRTIREGLKPGEPFLTTNFYPDGTGPDLSKKLKPGLRAITIPIDDLSSVGASTAVGSIVDVLFRVKPVDGDRAKRKLPIPEATVTLVQAAEIIAINRNEPTSRNPNGAVDVRMANQMPNTNAFRSVTLAVTPEQAHMLRTAMGHGDLYLMMSSTSQPPAHAIEPTTLEQMLGIKAPPEPLTTEIYRGGGRQTLIFEDSQLVEERFGGVPADASKATIADPKANDAKPNNNDSSSNNMNNWNWSRFRPTNGMGGGYGGGFPYGTTQYPVGYPGTPSYPPGYGN
ncbi:MAG: Flp pilus assembly protein CpaB [Planctomycetes bacterium]|nr:Flp pilus assembly protein CpaB [Planctomycetota bacterium]